MALIKVILFGFSGFYGGFRDYWNRYVFNLISQPAFALGLANRIHDCELSIKSFNAPLRLKFSRMVLEKALTRPYT
jgi:hypothetical protein